MAKPFSFVKLIRFDGKNLKVFKWQNSRFVEMNTKVIGILAMLLVATLFVAPTVAAFVTPSKSSSFGNSFSYSAPRTNLAGVDPTNPSTMASLASEIKRMNFGPSPQRPFGWTPYCIG
ncbi:MAG: hypothetical protein MUC66_05920 [Methanolinea sp.]|jgi:hypothetical protein|nr:hypothetical protein [Methanolinea sp.]